MFHDCFENNESLRSTGVVSCCSGDETYGSPVRLTSTRRIWMTALFKLRNFLKCISYLIAQFLGWSSKTLHPSNHATLREGPSSDEVLFLKSLTANHKRRIETIFTPH
ncbi:hypothetical protein TNCV_2118441 [Trichonephila clavipes]|nr:hypothetical protein TNCV_2118441 [Trichonephila clavipes]